MQNAEEVVTVRTKTVDISMTVSQRCGTLIETKHMLPVWKRGYHCHGCGCIKEGKESTDCNPREYESHKISPTLTDYKNSESCQNEEYDITLISSPRHEEYSEGFSKDQKEKEVTRDKKQENDGEVVEKERTASFQCF